MWWVAVFSKILTLQCKVFRNVINATFCKWVTATNSSHAHRRSLHRAMLFNGLNHITRASWIITATWWKSGWDKFLVKSHRFNNNIFNVLHLLLTKIIKNNLDKIRCEIRINENRYRSVGNDHPNKLFKPHIGHPSNHTKDIIWEDWREKANPK